MPELPEVETITRQLNSVLKGQIIRDVEVRGRKGFVGAAKEVVGKKIVSVGRRAKLAIIELVGKSDRRRESQRAPRKDFSTSLATPSDSENQRGKQKRTEGTEGIFLLVHLKMTGQLIYQKSKVPFDKLRASKNQKDNLKTKFKDHKPHFKFDHRIVGGHPTADWVADLPNKHTRVVLQLTKGMLFFNDQRMFGWMKVVNRDQLENSEFRNYGPDITDKKVTDDYFYKILQRSGRAVKLVITDQTRVAGVGNIYANDGLFCARIDPRRRADSLSRKDADRLLPCLKKVINNGIKYGGATASDDKFVQTTGL